MHDAKILLINIHDNYTSYFVLYSRAIGRLRELKSYSALLNSRARFALALRSVFLGSWARFPRVNSIALILILLQQNYWGGLQPT